MFPFTSDVVKLFLACTLALCHTSSTVLRLSLENMHDGETCCKNNDSRILTCAQIALSSQIQSMNWNSLKTGRLDSADKLFKLDVPKTQYLPSLPFHG